MTNEQNNSNIVIYNNDELELNVSVENETIWLTQKQIAELFEVTIQKYLIVQEEGKMGRGKIK